VGRGDRAARALKIALARRVALCSAYVEMTDTELGTEFKLARRSSSVRIVTVSASVVDANTPHSSIES
jgi:hypothetical protein